MTSKHQPTRYPGIYKVGKRYVVRQRDGAGRMIARSAETVAEARALQIDLRTIHNDGRTVAKPLSFAAYAEEWIETYVGRTSRGIRESTRKNYRAMLRTEAIPYFGRMRLQEIQPRDIKSFAAALTAKGLKQTSVKRIIGPVKALLATAFEDGLIPTNPSANVRIAIPREYREGQPVTKALSEDQLELLLDLIDPDWRPFAELLAQTGMRIGEAVAVRWGDVDLVRGTLRVERAISQGVLDEPKSRYGKRTIPLSPRLFKIITERRREVGPVDLSTPLFANQAGAMIDPHNFRSRVMRPAAAEAGLEWATPHTLRHTFASRCFRHGCNLKQVQAMLGHHSPAFTLETYVHMLPEDLPDLGFLG